ncbi:hypothetical protein VE04_03642 [Pseudogymnoascus sp. 24MN13]|nr:hypothetical protein VE04_03642 [Pseudogymnoascus sp. 24MN13]
MPIEEPSLSQQRGTFTGAYEYNDTPCHYVSPDLSSFEEDIHLSFLCNKLFFGAPARGQKTLAEKSWIYRFAIRSTSKTGHESEQIPTSLTCALATQALAKAFFGRMHGQQAMTMKGADLYGSALRSLRGDLQHFDSYGSFSLLASLMTVYVYEIMGAMKVRKRTFLEQKDWKTVPWEDEPDSKSHLDGMTDIMADIPGLYEDLDTINGSPNTRRPWDLTLAKDTLDKCLEDLSKLESWFEVWKAQNPESFSEVESSSMSGLTADEDGDLFPTVLRFSSLGVANELALYYSTRIQLLSICREVDRLIESTNISTSAACEAGISWSSYSWYGRGSKTASIKLLAINICRSAEYHLLPDHAHAGALLFLLPAQVAAKSLGHLSREGHWITKMLGRGADLSGLSFTTISLAESARLAIYNDA